MLQQHFQLMLYITANELDILESVVIFYMTLGRIGDTFQKRILASILALKVPKAHIGIGL